MIQAVIIDDEVNNVNSLRNLLTKFCPGVEVIGTADNANSGYDLIKAKAPELAFLDIEMPFGNAFDLLNRLGEINFEIIFITAFDRYAIKAFKYSALDYLLKPVDIDELQKAVEKVTLQVNKKIANEKVLNLLQNMSAEKTATPKIAIAGINDTTFIQVQDITRLEAQKNYTLVHLVGGQKIMTTKNLGSYEELLPESSFCRIHHSHIVNLGFISKYKKGRGGHIVMEDGTDIEVSIRKKDAFLERFKQ
ncbi:MAG: LytTR family DNA-binding domain-containing protein [Bacteroidota bacterium]|nr:LytTR family DNA-binding domain-containing protein [Ferruginibacter sp.]